MKEEMLPKNNSRTTNEDGAYIAHIGVRHFFEMIRLEEDDDETIY